VTTDFEPDSEAWSQFESEFGVFTDTVGQVMKEGYEVGAEVVRRCSETRNTSKRFVFKNNVRN